MKNIRGTTKYEFSDNENTGFSHLLGRTSAGQGIRLNPQDFVLIHEDEQGVVAFKHINSREYVFLIPLETGYKLYVPSVNGSRSGSLTA